MTPTKIYNMNPTPSSKSDICIKDNKIYHYDMPEIIGRGSRTYLERLHESVQIYEYNRSVKENSNYFQYLMIISKVRDL